MVSLGSTRHYPLLISMPVAKQRLAAIAAGEPVEVNRVINTLSGQVYANGQLAILQSKHARIKDKRIEVELREAAGETWVRITIAPTLQAIAIFALLLALSGTALMLQSRNLGIALPLTVFAVYWHFVGYADLRKRVGLHIDSLYFSSPEALADANKKMLSVMMITNNAFLWLAIISIVAVLAWSIYITY